MWQFNGRLRKGMQYAWNVGHLQSGTGASGCQMSSQSSGLLPVHDRVAPAEKMRNKTESFADCDCEYLDKTR